VVERGRRERCRAKLTTHVEAKIECKFHAQTLNTARKPPTPDAQSPRTPKQVEASIDRIVTNFNWAVGQLCKCTQELRNAGIQHSGEGQGQRRSERLLEALQGQGALSQRRRRCRAMLDVSMKLLELLDVLLCHVNGVLVASLKVCAHIYLHIYAFNSCIQCLLVASLTPL
jgi:hypothetical protein